MSGSGQGGAPSGAARLDKCRLDKWLWQARFFRTRIMASDVIDNGAVRLNGVKMQKGGHMLRIGDVLTFVQAGKVRVVRVRAIPARRGPADEAQALYDDLSAAL